MVASWVASCRSGNKRIILSPVVLVSDGGEGRGDELMNNYVESQAKRDVRLDVGIKASIPMTVQAKENTSYDILTRVTFLYHAILP